MRRALLILALPLVAMILAACHGTGQTNYNVYWFDSQRCADALTQVIMPHAGEFAAIHATSGLLQAAGGADCKEPAAQPITAGTIEVYADFYKVNYGLCRFSTDGWEENAQDSYVGSTTWWVGSGCPFNDQHGSYYSASQHRVHWGSWHTHAQNSPVDHY